jgi:hypothetical protein
MILPGQHTLAKPFRAVVDRAHARLVRRRQDVPVDVALLRTVATKCSDFLAYVSGNRVVSIPVTLATLDSAVTVAGNFTDESAHQLAHKITG